MASNAPATIRGWKVSQRACDATNSPPIKDDFSPVFTVSSLCLIRVRTLPESVWILSKSWLKVVWQNLGSLRGEAGMKNE